jgi:hypothetical protein
MAMEIQRPSKKLERRKVPTRKPMEVQADTALQSNAGTDDERQRANGKGDIEMLQAGDDAR